MEVKQMQHIATHRLHTAKHYYTPYYKVMWYAALWS